MSINQRLGNRLNKLGKSADALVNRLDVDLYNVVYIQVEQSLSSDVTPIDSAEQRYLRDNYKNHMAILGMKSSPLFNWRGRLSGSIKEPSPNDQYILPRYHSALEPFVTRDITVADDVVTVETSSVLLSKSREESPITRPNWHITRFTPLGPEYCETTSYDHNIGQAYIHVGRLGSDKPSDSASDINKIPLSEVPVEIATPRVQTLLRTMSAATRLLEAEASPGTITHRIQREPHRGAKGHILN